MHNFFLGVHFYEKAEGRRMLRDIIRNTEAEGIDTTCRLAFGLAYDTICEAGATVAHQVTKGGQGSLAPGLIYCFDLCYPRALFDLEDFPLVLLYRGDRALLERPAISVVGTRQPSSDGHAMCRILGNALAEGGYVAISGLAFGVDASIHRGMLASRGKTIAVIPSGLHAITPASHLQLADSILDHGGLLLSERPLLAGAMRHDYLARNRLIAALAEKVVIVESGGAGGTLNTAHWAVNLGRQVYAMPGSIRNPVAVGTNQLIKEGAVPITGAGDLCLSDLCLSDDATRRGQVGGDISGTLDLGAMGRKVLDLMSEGGIWSQEGLLMRLSVPVASLLSTLMDLELLGLIENVDVGYRRK